MSATQYQGIPQAMMPLVRGAGITSDVWYRFFQTIWNQVSSGTSTNVTLQGVSNQATAALQAANDAAAGVTAERERALAAEALLQGQITTNANNITTLQGQITNLQNQINGLQTQINTINTRLTNAGIP